MDAAPGALRIARPTADLDAAVAFYRDGLGLPVLAAWRDHDGYDGAVLGIPDRTRQLELLQHAGVRPRPTAEDQLVLYLGSRALVAAAAARVERHGGLRRAPANPYWERDGAACFTDPDGYWLVLSPDAWHEDAAG